tara:strand:- start:2507 stop:3217 length:711 start_codon:yes stop_codon:yes gene_type:complete
MDILHLHLEELYDTVDKFVLVESTTTFVGNPKELFFETHKDMYTKYLDKIVHVVVDDTPKMNNPWKVEKFQREAIDRGLSKLNLTDDDIIIIGDVDEIPDTTTLNTLREEGLTKPMSLEMDYYYYNFKCRNVGKWDKVKVIPYSIYKQYPHPDNIRSSKYDTIQKGGWHLSYFGTPEFISNKLTNFSHQEYNNPMYNDTEIIKKRMEEGDDLFGRPDSKFEQVETLYLPKNYTLIS